MFATRPRFLIHKFVCEQFVPHPVAKVFAFFANPENLPRVMPPEQQLKIEHAAIITPAAMLGQLGAKMAGGGSEITLSYRPLSFIPLRVRWLGRIVNFEMNRMFCHEQVRGPFRRWQHCHFFRKDLQNGLAGTLLRDEVEYALPLSFLGDAANAVFIGRQMRRRFAYRQKIAAQLLEAMS